MHRVIFGLFLAISSLTFGKQTELNQSDVRRTMREIFSYHVENKTLDAKTVRRSFKLYIEAFDPDKNYLLHDEVAPYFSLSEREIQSVIDHYYKDQYPKYDELAALCAHAVRRNRQIREHLKEGVDYSLKYKPYNHYANSEYQLAGRIHRHLAESLSKKTVNYELFEKRLRRVELPYLEQTDHNRTVHILKALARSLDAHTIYYTPEEAAEFRLSLHKELEGIGIVLQEKVEGIAIVDLVEGGPAAKSHAIQKGDVIISIDDYSVESSSYEELLSRLKGKVGTKVKLTLLRNESEVNVTLRREKIVMHQERVQASAVPFGDGYIAKVTLPAFYDNSGNISLLKDVRAAINGLKEKGELYGMVLDLRDNTGGFLHQAVKVSGLFIAKGVVVISKYSNGEIRYTRDLDGRQIYTGPLVVLTSKLSASASELMAQALQDHGVAVVVGDERTYGKGTMQYQTVTEAKARVFYTVTIGRYYTASGRSTQIEGVHADIHVPTHLDPYNVGERFHQFPLSSDHLESVEATAKSPYIPYLKPRESTYRKMIPQLKKNSQMRLKNNKNFQHYLKVIRGYSPQKRLENHGIDDLQMKEAVHIIEDMLSLTP
ncbi:MAG: hypothetical protein SP1CHLAM54_12850 [Chlamydiia bacterium]|nr:hypothetical protein [Chlamydiia bacterium]MCH9616181.1 hypothetical protein [Chlamydiia bacterium]MCH9629833.1 hypothetical protein [Chlamydiia bacterium]